MPPKNKTKSNSGEVGIYDVELMNEDELKQYIEALKEESERMKTAFIDHQSNKREIEDLLRNTQEDILDRYETLMQKEIDMQQLLSESTDLLQHEYKDEMIKSLETNKRLAQNLIDNFIEVQEVRMFQQEKLKDLHKNLNDREREVIDINSTKKIHSIDLIAEAEEERAVIMKKKETSLEKIAKEFNEKYLEKKQNLFEEQGYLMDSILNSFFGKDSEKYPTTDQAEKMSEYFKDIFWKNIKASANLKIKVGNLEKELNKIKMLLKDAESENKELLSRIESKKYISENEEPTVSEKNDSFDKQLEYLIYENYTLHEKLRQVSEEINVLRSKFISSMRNIYKKADFASFLADQMVSSLLGSRKWPDEVSLNNNLKEDMHETTSNTTKISNKSDETKSDDKDSSDGI